MRALSKLVCAAAFGAAASAQPRQVAITLDGDPPAFRVANSNIITRINNPNFAAILKVTVDKREAQPISGDYRVEDGVLLFQPKYPLEPGLAYRATFKLASESATGVFTPPKPKVPSTTFVERVYPSTNVLPENQLKFYIHFSASMSKGEAAKRIHLIEEGAGEVKLPFLELDEELWDRHFKRLTVLFDPGRVKRGLVPNQQVGPPLQAGRQYTLVVDADWKDAASLPLKQGYEKKFTAGAAERSALDLKTWQVTAPGPDTSNPLTIDFPRPIDAALLQRFLDVNDAKGNLVKGTVTLDNEEKRWVFTPPQKWLAGKYSIEILSTLEDLAGNKIGRAFDVDRFEQVQKRVTSETVSIPFTIGPAEPAAPRRK